MSEARTGSALNQATRPFASEDVATSWRVVLVTLAAIIGGLVFTALIPYWPLKIVGAVFTGLVQIRLFICYHDYNHGAILRDTKLGDALMSAVGFYMLTVRSVWRETHNYHHKNNAKLIGSSIGSFPVVTIGMYRSVKPGQRRLYHIIRHPLFIFGGYFTVFLIGMSFAPFKRAPRRHWGGPIAVAIHLATVGLVAWWLGWVDALCLVVLPLVVAHGLGAYLFYVQHNFPGMQLRDRRSWDYTFAALRSSSMFHMGPIMHWFTGNIGYHHVHHLNHRIPFYRLPEAMAALPELQDPSTVTWKWRDTLACLRLAVWDPDQNRMLTKSEVTV